MKETTIHEIKLVNDFGSYISMLEIFWIKKKLLSKEMKIISTATFSPRYQRLSLMLFHWWSYFEYI